jgi:hypothetical protein
MSDDTPTQRFPEQNPIQEDLKQEKQKSRGLMIGLIIAGALLLITIVILLILLLGSQGVGQPQAGDTQSPGPGLSETPTPEATESDTPSATPEPTQEPEQPPAQPQQPQQPTGAAFTTFNPTTQVSCSKGGPDFTPDPPSILISWATVRADSAWIVQGTSDAADSGYMQIPLNGNQSNFQYTLQFPCFQASTKYTITLVGSDGNHVSKSWTVNNIGDKD